MRDIDMLCSFMSLLRVKSNADDDYDDDYYYLLLLFEFNFVDLGL